MGIFYETKVSFRYKQPHRMRTNKTVTLLRGRGENHNWFNTISVHKYIHFILSRQCAHEIFVGSFFTDIVLNTFWFSPEPPIYIIIPISLINVTHNGRSLIYGLLFIFSAIYSKFTVQPHYFAHIIQLNTWKSNWVQ